jgi:hypothetical protein
MPQLSADELNRLCNEVLSALEIREAKLLNWGFINGAQVLDNLEAQLPELLRPLATNSPELADIWLRAQIENVTGVTILDNLMRRKLIFRSGNRYRTRFAETIRSLYLLRQRFSFDDWLTGERLVGDMKILLQRRRYPRREVSSDELFRQLAPLNLSPLRQNAVSALLRDVPGQPLVLARFQAQTINRIFRNLRSTEDSAVVIGAGTGAGKTKAFYIPALAFIAETISNARYMQALALYPRKELLKDQLRETYAESRKLDDLLQQSGKRSITLGAYYGDVPRDADDIRQGRRDNWHRTRERNGWLCPYFACPHCGEQTMAWLDQDIERESTDNRRGVFGRYARLDCQECGTQVGSEHLLLTRRQIAQNPPDVLFTTTEMLNRRMSDLAERALFGIDVDLPPRLLLMDEIHLNEGIHGAQIAYLLRRWRYARGRNLPGNSLCIVGLSATVTQAETFFARLTGVSIEQVTYITPADSDLVKEGLEYNVVLKGDPLSGAALLSTSVRTAMLVCRILDPLTSDVSANAYGRRVFAFSDKLDVINRWYHIEKESENPAEPYSRFLSITPSDPSAKARYDQGQNWWFVTAIHDDPDVLTSGLRLDITSSQYAGVDERANLVIASSTLEVGYNDPTVGAIIQHKTPYSRAAFIQRKGRAGRTRTMRPWTLLITSAYGHDRWAFQHAESLFDPILPPLDLPLENYYVQKIQATFALMDWLAGELKDSYPAISIWNLIRNDEPQRNTILEAARGTVVQILQKLIESDSVLSSFKKHLQGALQLNADQDYVLNTLLWGEPRPLLLETVPTLLRQVETGWQTIHWQNDKDWQILPWTDAIADRPLPDFVPPALFSDLKSPDLTIRIPEARLRRGESVAIRAEETLSVALSLSEFVPGKVNKRFAHKDKIRESHWLELPDSISSSDTALELDQLQVKYDPAPAHAASKGIGYAVYCPKEITLSTVPRNVRPTSNAFFAWESNFVVHTRYGSQQSQDSTQTGTPIQLYRQSSWRHVFQAVTAYTQAHNTWVEVTRFAAKVDVSTRYEEGYERRLHLSFLAGGQPAALGFTVAADALRFSFSSLNAEALRQSADWPLLYQRLGSQFILHLLRNDVRLNSLNLNHLEVEWLWQIALSVVVETAIERQIGLAEATSAVQIDYVSCAQKVISIIFQNRPPDEQAGGTSDDQAESVSSESQQAPLSMAHESDALEERTDIGYLQNKLLGLIRSPVIQQVLTDYLQVLWDDAHPELDSWLQKVYAFSLGAALYSALLELKPDVQLDDLHMDVDGNDIWISETSSGGIGLIAKLADAVAQNPRYFHLLLSKVIRSCPREELAGYLDHIAADLGAYDRVLTQSFAAIRTTLDLPRMEDTQRTLAAALNQRGIPATRQLSVAINTKFLRPNSGPDTDLLLAKLVDFWHREQTRLNATIDLRIIAVAAAGNADIQAMVHQVLTRVGESALASDAGQVYNLLQSLLWLDCRDSCPDCIERPQRYQSSPKPSRALLQTLLRTEISTIHYPEVNWQAQLEETLATLFQARLCCAEDNLTSCRSDLLTVMSTPIEVGYQVLYPVIERIERRGREWDIQVVLPELIEA